MDSLRVVAPIVAVIAAVGIAYYLLAKAPKVFLVSRERKRARVMEVEALSHDTKRIRLSLGSKSTTLGLPVGKHLVIYCPNPKSCMASNKWNGKTDPDKGKQEIDRKYTPVTGDECPGYVDLVVKIYRPGKVKMPDGKEIDWEDGGKCGLFLDSKKVGDFVEIMGPLGVNEYLGRGKFKVPGKTVTVKHVCMMAGGTGLTPMLQVAQAAVRDPGDTTSFSLIYANKTEGDILCRDLLDDLAAKSGGRFEVHYTLDFPPAGWTHRTGFITEAMIKECFGPSSADTLVLLCGPPPMLEFACKPNLHALGYGKEQIVAF